MTATISVLSLLIMIGKEIELPEGAIQGVRAGELLQIDEENWKVFANCTWNPGSSEWEMTKRQIHAIFQLLRASTAHWFECCVTNRAGPSGSARFRVRGLKCRMTARGCLSGI